MPLPIIDYTALTDSEVTQLKSEASLEEQRRIRVLRAPAQAEAVVVEYLKDVGRVEGSVWVQPTGAHDAYPVGYKVKHQINGKDVVWESLIVANTTIPGSDPRWWKDLTTELDPNAWNPNYKDYLIGDVVTYETKSYECLQGHTSQPSWTPAAVPSLWKELSVVTPPDPEPEPDPGPSAWSDASVAYVVGDRVTYNSATYVCLQAHTSQAGWTPAAVPSLWRLE